MPKVPTLEERWKEEGEGLHVIPEGEDDPFLEPLDEDDEDDSDLEDTE